MWPFRRGRKRKIHTEIHPDEILIDSQNIQHFDRDQFEGRLERPIGRRSFAWAGMFVVLVFLGLTARAGNLQIAQGASYAERARDNQLSQQTVFADRGIIADRTGTPLAYNVRDAVTDDFARRVYADYRGIAHVVGYVKPPAKDSSGVYFRDSFTGVAGAERAFDRQLAGENGLKLSETDVRGTVVGESVVQPSTPGQKVTLSIDAKVTQALYDAIAQRADESHFQGGAGVIMDVKTGEILALTSYPEYSPQALEDGDAQALQSYNSDKRQPFLDRATAGLYAPGSIIKPIVATAALTEGVIDENKKILSTGSISVPNPYDPAHPSVFHDWRPQGWVDVRDAIAVSSDVYFYEVGGGYPGQAGLGIALLDKYFSMFGFGKDPGLAGFVEQDGNIPTPAWKAANFPDDPTWRIGDTYHTAIGQYGMQVTPMQAVREAAAIANNGFLMTPTLVASSTAEGTPLPVSAHALEVVREGMRQGVTEGIAQAVNFGFVHVAAKTGTAQVGLHNEYVNSWMIGFFPYENPRYAYAVVLERGPAGTLMGAPAAVGTFFSWMRDNAPQYLTQE